VAGRGSAIDRATFDREADRAIARAGGVAAALAITDRRAGAPPRWRWCRPPAPAVRR
jgi:hypothetical protein